MQVPRQCITINNLKKQPLGLAVAQAYHINKVKLKGCVFKRTYSTFYVTEVYENSIAKKVGIYKGDRLLKVNDVDISRVRTYEELAKIFTDIDVIDTLTIVSMTPEERGQLAEIEEMEDRLWRKTHNIMNKVV